MSGLLQALRFMYVVPPLPRLMHMVMGGVAFIGAGAIALDPAVAPQALVPVLTLQLFAVSTGFALHLRRGYYDLLVTTGVSRIAVAGAQWMLASLPGAAAWLALASVEAIAAAGWPALFSPGAAAAMWVASTLPWACSVALPRFSAAIGLIVTWVTLVRLGPATANAFDASVLASAPFAPIFPRVHDWLQGAGGWIASADPAAGAAALGGDVPWIPTLVATIVMLGSLLWIRQASFPLESGQ